MPGAGTEQDVLRGDLVQAAAGDELAERNGRAEQRVVAGAGTRVDDGSGFVGDGGGDVRAGSIL
jgi:hypothetical protein